MAAMSFRRSPTAETPMSLRSSAVSCDRTSASILLSRNLFSYSPRPRRRSHSPTSMGLLHMYIEGSRLAERCPATKGLFRVEYLLAERSGKDQSWRNLRVPQSAFWRIALIRLTPRPGGVRPHTD